MTDHSEMPPADPVASEAPAPLLVPGLPSPAGNNRYQIRFGAVYATLGALLVAAMAAFAVLVVKPGHKPPAAWSNWAPTPGSVSTMSSQIADHVSHAYRLNKAGTQLVAVVPSKPTVTSGTTNIAIKAIAIRKAANTNTGIEVLGSTKTEMFTFCGLGIHCSISGGQATSQRGRLVRREALEVALYTFKFVPSVDSVIAFMPPAPGSTTSPLVFLRKANFSTALARPLRATLPLNTPPLPTQSDLGEAATIDQLTLSSTFNYQLQALQSGGAALVLDPQT
jgi:hypothetical protein